MTVTIKQAIDDKLFCVDIAFNTATLCDDQCAFDVQLAFDDAINLNIAFYFEFSANRTAFGDES